MDVVLRTPTGEAELSVGAGQEDVALAELIERLTGLAPSQVVYVDGRAVPSSAVLGTSGVLSGSVISTVDDAFVPPTDGRVELVQVAGEGAGARTWLRTGRYRLGPGRRLSAGELEQAPVDRPMLELEVDDAGAVVVRAASAAARLDGLELTIDAPTAWTTGLIDVGGRVFTLGQRDPRAAAQTGHRLAGVGIDGTAAFNRPPRPAAAPEPPPLDVPDGGVDGLPPPRFPLALLLAPLPVAVALAIVLDDLRYLLIALLSVLMAGVNWLGDRGERGRDAAGVVTARSPAAQFAAAAAQRHRDDVERRRHDHPDLATAVGLAERVSPELWQRRAGHPDAFQIPIGLAEVNWSPPLNRGPHALADAQTIVAALGPLPMVPVTVDLLSERGLGVVGGAEFTRSIARGLLVEATVTHGPADLDVVVLTSPDRAHVWEWVKWLPHARTGGSARIYSTDEQVSGWAAAVRRGWERPSRPTAPAHVTLVVVDEPSWWRDRAAPLRPLFSDASIPLRFVALTNSSADVPAVCTTVVTASPDHGATVDYLMDRRRVEALRPFLASEGLALATARRLAPLDDPDVPIVPPSALPARVPILPLLGFDVPTVAHVRDRWSNRQGHALPVTIGVSDLGPMTIDLVADGPHGLIAGTAGSGKSELLRTIVAGLGATVPPADVNFVLIDWKGGSAYGACAQLPHTVGVVADLDEHLAARLVRCLRAELDQRAEQLRVAGAASLAEHRQLAETGVAPRLLIVVDEIGSVTAEVPELAPALVEIAQRGHRLGVHVLFSTQRPAGVVDHRIRAETTVRIALRVQDDGDSLDVVGTNDAAHLPTIVGRGYVRVGTGEVVMFQSATSSSRSDDQTITPGAIGVSAIDVAPYVISRELTPMESRLVRLTAEEVAQRAHGPSDLERLVAAIGDAAHELGQADQRRPCPEPLPAELALDEFFARFPGDAVPYGLVDLPDQQRQEPAWWAPGSNGSMLVYGIAGAGTSSLLVTLALGMAERYGPDDVHMYCIDADDGLLAPLAALPHVGAVVRLDEPDRIARVTTALADLLEQRSRRALDRGAATAVTSAEPTVVLFVDNLGALRQMLEDRRDLQGVWADLERVIREGRPLGICAVLTAKQERMIPASVATHVQTRLVMQLGEQFPYATFGLRASEIPRFTPGRAVRPDDKSEVQLVMPPVDVADVIERAHLEPAIERPVRRIDALPPAITVADVAGAARVSPASIEVPVGIDTRSGEAALCPLVFGEAVFITGAPGTGRSSLLVAIARACAVAAPDVAMFTVAPRGGPLDEVDGADSPVDPHAAAAWVERIESSGGRRIVLVDDADQLGGPSFERLAALRDDDLVVVVAGRGDDLRASGHWTKPMQRFRTGVLLRPAPLDGDVVRVSLGPRLPHFAPHRGVLVVDGEQIPVLAAVAEADAGDGGDAPGADDAADAGGEAH